MATQHIHDLLSKLNELRAVFILGQRAIPFIEEVVYFLREISPLLEEVNDSLADSTRKMPKASSQLKSVTQATEMATTEILDLIDVVLRELDEFNQSRSQAPQYLEQLIALDQELQQRLPSALRAELEACFATRHQLYAALQEPLVHQDRLIASVRERMNRIMLALQVQDITAQQLAAVNHLIESVRQRMAHLIQRLGGEVLEGLDMASLFTPGTFDPHAHYDRSGKRQQRADAIIEAFQQGDLAEAPLASQDEIDALFSGSAPTSQSEIDALFNGTPTSQQEIDALFGGKTPASQDEIDALFNKPRS